MESIIKKYNEMPHGLTHINRNLYSYTIDYSKSNHLHPRRLSSPPTINTPWGGNPPGFSNHLKYTEIYKESTPIIDTHLIHYENNHQYELHMQQLEEIDRTNRIYLETLLKINQNLIISALSSMETEVMNGRQIEEKVQGGIKIELAHLKKSINNMSRPAFEYSRKRNREKKNAKIRRMRPSMPKQAIKEQDRRDMERRRFLNKQLLMALKKQEHYIMVLGRKGHSIKQ